MAAKTIKATPLVLCLLTIMHAYQIMECEYIVQERIQTFISNCISDDL